VEPASARAWAQLGVVALVRDDLGTASDALFRSLDLYPSGGEARYHLALLRVMVGAQAEARELLEDLVAEEGGWETEAAALLDRM
jgi:Tfp pilus assembly protein PilF